MRSILFRGISEGYLEHEGKVAQKEVFGSLYVENQQSKMESKICGC